MSIADVIAKVQKLRSLAARAGTLAEAEAAASAAEDLIARHRLSEAQIEADNGRPSEAINEEVEPLWEKNGRDEPWRQILASNLGKHYGCYGYRRRRGGAVAYTLFGRPSDVAIMRYMFSWLCLEIVRLSMSERGLAARNAFRYGAANGFAKALRATAATQTATKEAALVLLNRHEEAERYALGLLDQPIKPPARTSMSDRGAFARGHKAGECLTIGDRLPAPPLALPEGAR